MKNLTLKIVLFAIISLSSIFEAKSQYFNLETPNNSAYAFQITIFDNASNVLWSAYILANSNPAPVGCLSGIPDNVTFESLTCAYNIPINSGPSSCPFGTCPCAAFASGATTFTSVSSGTSSCGSGPLVTITIN